MDNQQQQQQQQQPQQQLQWQRQRATFPLLLAKKGIEQLLLLLDSECEWKGKATSVQLSYIAPTNNAHREKLIVYCTKKGIF